MQTLPVIDGGKPGIIGYGNDVKERAKRINYDRMDRICQPIFQVRHTPLEFYDLVLWSAVKSILAKTYTYN
jgi:hypothetical protein